jgi:hypothetical protein
VQPIRLGLRHIGVIGLGNQVRGATQNVAALVAAGVLLAGCGAQPSETAGNQGPPPQRGQADTAARSASPVELVGQGLVLQNSSHGPQLCVGAITASSVPQCDGPDIPNWDWGKVGGETSRSGTTEGDYVVIGNFDVAGDTFTLTRPAIPSSEYDGPPVGSQPEQAALGTPCNEPAGGWRVLDPVKTTDDSVEVSVARAREMAGFAGVWIDRSPSTKSALNDPSLFILNVAFTRDLEARERDVRKTWGGALCVSQSVRTEKQLERIRDDVFEAARPQVLTAGGGHDYIPLGVIYDDGTLQRQFDKQYGEGVVKVSSALSPYTG